MSDYNEAVYTITVWGACLFVIIAIVGFIDLYFMARRTLKNAKNFFKYAEETEREARKYHE